jgi:hypothetical protein
VSPEPERRLGLSPHADLKTRPGGDVLVLPERAIRLGGSGAEILRACATPCHATAIVATLRERYPEAAQIEIEVRAFLEEMLELGGLVELDDLDADPSGAHR